jgi:hypothetical protein
MTINTSAETSTHAGELGPDFAAKREAYYTARNTLDQLIDAPDKTITVFEYINQLAAAKAAVRAAHKIMMNAWPAQGAWAA